MMCPDCKGKKESLVFYSGGSKHGFGPLPCTTCDGEGEVSEEKIAWITRGRELRDKRVAAGRSLREEAEMLGITSVELSRRERGKVNPDGR